MNRFATISTTALFLLVGFGAPTLASQEKPEKQQEGAKPAKQEQQAKPQQQQQKSQQQAKTQQNEQQKQQKNTQQQQAQSNKQQQQKSRQQAKTQQNEQQKQQKNTQQQQAQSNKQQQQKSQQQARSNTQSHQQLRTVSSHGAPQRSAQAISAQHSQPQLRLSERGSGRIPDAQFRSHFGSGHRFHMGNPVMVDGYSRFQYGGFWFGFVDPWPADWYYTDDCYIDYTDGGYYMYNPYYPGARFALTVVI